MISVGWAVMANGARAIVAEATALLAAVEGTSDSSREARQARAMLQGILVNGKDLAAMAESLAPQRSRPGVRRPLS